MFYVRYARMEIVTVHTIRERCYGWKFYVASAYLVVPAIGETMAAGLLASALRIEDLPTTRYENVSSPYKEYVMRIELWR